jgi:hypothetical protein
VITLADLGGYYAVAYVRDTLLREAIDNAWSVRWRDACGAVSFTIATALGSAAVSGVVSAEKPSLNFFAFRNRVRVELNTAFRLSVSIAGGAAGGAFVRMSRVVETPVLVSQTNVTDKAVLDLSQLSVVAGHQDITYFNEGDVVTPSPSLVSVMNSDALLNQLVGNVRQRVASFLVFHLPTDNWWLQILTVSTASGSAIIPPPLVLTGVRILDNWMAIGIDKTGPADAETHGSAATIGPPPPPPAGAENDQVVVVIDSSALQVDLEANAKRAIAIMMSAHAEVHPDLKSTSVALIDGGMMLVSTGNVDLPFPAGNTNYSAHIAVYPRVNYRELWFPDIVMSEVVATVQPGIVLDTSFLTDVILDFISIFTDVWGRLGDLQKEHTQSLFLAQATVDVPDVPTMGALIAAHSIVITPDHVAIYAVARSYTKPQAHPDNTFTQAALDPYAVSIRSRYLPVSSSTMGGLDVDGTYLLKLQLRRRDGTQVMQDAVWSGPGGSVAKAVDLWDPALYLETELEGELTIERPPGRVIGHDAHSITIMDLFDRSHPYARWWREHWWYDWSRPHRKPHMVIRQSVIHKTDIRERCRFSDTGTGKKGRPVSCGSARCAARADRARVPNTIVHVLLYRQATDEKGPPSEEVVVLSMPTHMLQTCVLTFRVSATAQTRDAILAQSAGTSNSNRRRGRRAAKPA